MTKYRSKTELMKAIQVEHHRLDNLLNAIPKEDMLRKGVVGDWSIKDVLAHLTAWERLLLDWYKAGFKGRNPSLPNPVGMSKKAIDALNKEIFKQNREVTLADVWKNYRDNYLQVLATLEVIREKDMFMPGRYAWTGKFTLADYIAGNTCNHYLWAKTKIRTWINTRV